MISENRYKNIVKISAWYDLLVILPFTTPWTLEMLYGFLQQLHAYGQFSGQMHSLNAAHYLFGNLMGSVILVWSLMRILQPGVLPGRLDAVARYLFCLWQIYAWQHGFSTVILFFTFVELSFGIAQSLPVRREASEHEAGLRSAHA
ncbi:hypothetical protein [Undibacterium squillarum]|uniref:hypothetical protein n=1 Tax=Undibacterium squillarum TaxID=1131567 RepID=UPI0035B35733